MYTFIPIRPDKYSWDTRPWTSATSLNDLVKQMKETTRLRYVMRGHISFRDTKRKEMIFSGPTELASHLELLKWDPAPIDKVWIYKLGYFIIE